MTTMSRETLEMFASLWTHQWSENMVTNNYYFYLFTVLYCINTVLYAIDTYDMSPSSYVQFLQQFENNDIP